MKYFSTFSTKHITHINLSNVADKIDKNNLEDRGIQIFSGCQWNKLQVIGLSMKIFDIVSNKISWKGI